MRAKEIAATHIVQGSRVTYMSQSISRSLPSASAAWRIAKSSQWAVGSRSASVRLCAFAITVAWRTITQPTGTSPAAAPARASSSASPMKDECGTAGLPLLPASNLVPGITALYTGSTKHVDSRHDAEEPGDDHSMHHAARDRHPGGAGRADRQDDRARRLVLEAG